MDVWVYCGSASIPLTCLHRWKITRQILCNDVLFFHLTVACCCRRTSVFLKRCIITNWPSGAGQRSHVSKSVSHFAADAWWLERTCAGQELSASICSRLGELHVWMNKMRAQGPLLDPHRGPTLLLNYMFFVMSSFGGRHSGCISLKQWGLFSHSSASMWNEGLSFAVLRTILWGAQISRLLFQLDELSLLHPKPALLLISS